MGHSEACATAHAAWETAWQRSQTPHPALKRAADAAAKACPACRPARKVCPVCGEWFEPAKDEYHISACRDAQKL